MARTSRSARIKGLEPSPRPSAAAFAHRVPRKAARPRPEKPGKGRPRGTGAQRVYERLREKILKLELLPGTLLNEAALEQEFGISRTPVREALIKLASEGLISILPNRGAQVASIDIGDIPQIFEALSLCQRATMRWCSLRRRDEDLQGMRQISEEFSQAARRNDFDHMSDANKRLHIAIARACGNKYIAQTYEALLGATFRLARTAFAAGPLDPDDHSRYYSEVIRDHQEMLAAIERQDAEAADRLGRQHAELFRSRIAKFLEANPRFELALRETRKALDESMRR